MQSNPIMERVVRLSEQWKATLTDFPDLRIISWAGSSSTEYSMIKGFIMFQMSEECTLDDRFILCGQPFTKDTAKQYGYLIGKSISQYFEIWNNDEATVKKNGEIKWKYEPDRSSCDAENFVLNINQLADEILPEEDNVLLVMVLFPNELREFEAYREWIASLLDCPLSDKIRIMLYDRQNARLLDDLLKKDPRKFGYLIPDLDMGTAINETLENVKHERSEPEDKDAITFQQHLISLTEAVSKGENRRVHKFADAALLIAKNHQWPHLEAIVYYFMYSFFISLKQYHEAENYINFSIDRMEKAVSLSGEEYLMGYCEYISSKAMLFLMQEKYTRAVDIYDEALQVALQLDNPVLQIGLYQMKGICYRHSGDQEKAWDSFVCGWKLVENEGEDFIQSQPQYKYYASEMLKVRYDRESKWEYECRFRDLWGNEWSEEIGNELKQNRQKEKIFGK